MRDYLPFTLFLHYLILKYNNKRDFSLQKSVSDGVIETGRSSKITEVKGDHEVSKVWLSIYLFISLSIHLFIFFKFLIYIIISILSICRNTTGTTTSVRNRLRGRLQTGLQSKPFLQQYRRFVFYLRFNISNNLNECMYMYLLVLYWDFHFTKIGL